MLIDSIDNARVQALEATGSSRPALLLALCAAFTGACHGGANLGACAADGGCSTGASCDSANVCAPALPITLLSPVTVLRPYEQGYFAKIAAGGGYAWSIDNGTITAGGMTEEITFTAGLTGTTTLTCLAEDSAGNTQRSTLAIPIMPFTVTLTPASATLSSGHTQRFTAATSDGAVRWSLMEGIAGGSIDSVGTYTPPVSSVGLFHVVATSIVDAAVTAVAPVTVIAAPDATIDTCLFVQPGEAGLTATVAAHDGETYAWTIGNGSLNDGMSTEQISFTAGEFATTSVSCTVTNAAGDTDTKTAMVSLDGGPDACMDGGTDPGDAGAADGGLDAGAGDAGSDAGM